MRKHFNTKHGGFSHEASDKNKSETEMDSEDDLDFYQLEIVNIEEVYACNLCIDAFDSEKN